MVELKLKFPTEISEGSYASEIVDENNGPIVVQSSRVFWDKANKLILDNAHGRKGIETFYDKVKNVENQVCEQICQNSENWFGTELEFDTVTHSLFATSLNVPSRFNEPFSMHVNVSKDVSLYDAKKRPRTLDDINGEVTVLLHAKRVVLNSMSAHIDWELVQVLIHKKKSIINLSDLRIQEESENEYRSEPIELFKKPKKKVEVVEPVEELPEVVEKTETVEPEETVEESEEIEELEPKKPKFVLED